MRGGGGGGQASFTNLWVVLGMCKWDLGKVRNLSCCISLSYLAQVRQSKGDMIIL